MIDLLRLDRRLVLGAAGALSLLGGMFQSSARAAAAPTQGGAAPEADALRTEFVLEAHVNIAAALTVGESALGLRRLIPITGGSFKGPRLQGEVVPGGADYQLVRPDGVTSIEARYTLRVSDGSLIYIANRGILVRAVEGPAPAPAYVRTVPEFEAPIGPHDWLNKSVFLGTLDGSQFAKGFVVIRVYRVV